jgi:hypothetical protein
MPPERFGTKNQPLLLSDYAVLREEYDFDVVFTPSSFATAEATNRTP